MRVSALARLILLAFVCIFISAAGYLLLDALGAWSRLPVGLTQGIETVTGLILLFALFGHLVLAAGALPRNGSEDRPRV
jgi:hypothetical protein